jgi:hypothetical protein
VTALVTVRQVGGIDLEVGAGQIIEQNVELDTEQRSPALHQMGKQGVLVLQQPVMAGIKLVRLGQTKVAAQDIGHGALAEPVAVQFPLAARRNQAIGHQNLKDLIPARALAARRQALLPEAIQFQLPPQVTGQPAGAPLPWPVQAQLGQVNPHHPVIGGGGLDRLRRKQRQRPWPPGILVKDFDRLAPSLGLRGIDLAQI